MSIKITTWNINSLRLRLPLLQQLVANENPDVICLQETKVQNDLFPLMDVKLLGYEHVIFEGIKSYNGVAILSKLPIESHFSTVWGEARSYSEDQHKKGRHLAARLSNGMEVHNFYIPAGGDIADVTINPKFAYKLDMVNEVAGWFKTNRQHSDKLVLVGDLNIAPLEHDVWSHKQLLSVVSHTPIEVEHFTNMQNSVNWVDAMRHFTPHPEKLYTWWSYRNHDWKVHNRGRRLDHVLVTEPLKASLKNMTIHAPFRDVEKPSDHVPVTVEFTK